MGCCFSPSSSSDPEYVRLVTQPGERQFGGPKSPTRITKEDFAIEKVIGRGTFGKVFLVRKIDSGQFFAMKALKKDDLAAKNQQDHTRTQRKILETMNKKCPFIVELKYAFQTPDKLYFVVEYVNGGELFFHLRKEKRFSQYRARYYAAEILLALESLHKNNIIYRDLKPENVLLDMKGHIKVTDFGLSKRAMNRRKKAFTFCGTPQYLAPQIIKGSGHDKAVDWWSLGALIYEMLAGIPPFYAKNRKEVFDNILTRPPAMKKYFTPEACSLLNGLLTLSPQKRLGGGERDSQEVKEHPFFRGVDWDAMWQKQLPAPYVPLLASPHSTDNIDKMFLNEPAIETPIQNGRGSKGRNNVYEDFTYQDDKVQLRH